MPNKSVHKKRGNSNGWKEARQIKQSKSQTKIALLALAAIVFILFLAQAIKFTQTLFHPWKDIETKRTVIWNGVFNINLIVKAKGISLLSYNTRNNQLTIIDLPDQIYLESSHGFGAWQLSSIYGLGETQKNLGGRKLLQDTLRNLLGLPIDGVLDFSGKYLQKTTKDIVSEMRKSPFSIVNLLSYLKTNLTPFELISLNFKLASVRFDKVDQIILNKVPELLIKSKLPDGTDILTVDTVKLDSIMSDMVDSTIKDEHKTISIFNATNHPGLAQKAARILSNIGGEVIITSNAESLLKATKVSGVKSKTLDHIKQIFKVSDIIDPKDKDIVSSRADINLLLGEDYFEQL